MKLEQPTQPEEIRPGRLFSVGGRGGGAYAPWRTDPVRSVMAFSVRFHVRRETLPKQSRRFAHGIGGPAERSGG